MSFDPVWWLLGVSLVALLACTWLMRGQWRGTRLAALLLVAVMALQPGQSPERAEATTYDLLVMVDRTTSMGATDWDGDQPRTDGVSADIAALLEQRPGARVAVVTFDNEARVAVPWTTDQRAVVSYLATMGWREEGYASGSDISAGLDLARELLEREDGARERVLVYLGDGEQTSPDPPASFAPLRPLVDAALVLGYGTDAGATMETFPGSGTLVERDGEAQVSRIDEGALRSIASDLGARYQHRVAPSPLPQLGGGGPAAVGAASHPWVMTALGAVLGLLVVWDLHRVAVAARAAAREERS